MFSQTFTPPVNTFTRTFRNSEHSHLLIYIHTVTGFLYFGEANLDEESSLKTTWTLSLPLLRNYSWKVWEGQCWLDEDKTLKERVLHGKPDAQIGLHGKHMKPGAQMEVKLNCSREEKKPGWGFTTQTHSFLGICNNWMKKLSNRRWRQVETWFKMGRNKFMGKFVKCGKEGRPTDIMRHIEANHLEGVSISCNHCDKFFRSTNFQINMFQNINNSKSISLSLFQNITHFQDKKGFGNPHQIHKKSFLRAPLISSSSWSSN